MTTTTYRQGKNGPYRAIDPKVEADEQLRRLAIRADRLERGARMALNKLERPVNETSVWYTIDKASRILREALR